MFTLHGRHHNFRYCTAIDVPFRTFCNSSTASCAALCSLRWSMGKVRGQLSNQPDVSSARNPREVKIPFWVSNDWKWWDVFLVGIHAVPCLAHFLFKNYNCTYSKQTCTCERNKLIKIWNDHSLRFRTSHAWWLCSNVLQIGKGTAELDLFGWNLLDLLGSQGVDGHMSHYLATVWVKMSQSISHKAQQFVS